MILNITKKTMNYIMAVVLVAGLAAGIKAQGTLKQDFQFYMDGKIGGELIKKGNYSVIIPEAEQGKIEIKVGKKVITAQFTKKANANEANSNQMTYRDNGDGTLSVATLTPKGRKYTLVLSNDVATK